MKTAESIEEQSQREESKGEPAKKYPRGLHPNSHTPIGGRNGTTEHLTPTKWRPGQSGNPGGRPKDDVAKEIAKAVFENNKEALYKAYAKAAMRGNAYAFKELADRAYGKLKETHSLEVSEYHGTSEEQLRERIAQLERDLGYAAQIDDAGRTGIAQARAAETKTTPQD